MSISPVPQGYTDASPLEAASPPVTEADLDIEPGAETEGADFRELFALARRNLKLILACALLTLSLSAAWAYTRAPVFRAGAVVRLADVRRSLTGALGDQAAAMERFTGSLTDPVLSQIEVLRSRTLVGRALDGTGYRLRPLDLSRSVLSDVSVAAEAVADTLSVAFSEQGYRVRGRGGTAAAAYGEPVSMAGVRFTIASRPRSESAEIAVLDRERAINRVLRALSTAQRERTDVIDIRFESSDPETAQQTLHNLVETFQAVNAERARNQSRRRRIFLEEQLRASDSLVAYAQLELSRLRKSTQGFTAPQRYAVEQQGLLALDVRREELAAERASYQRLLDQVATRQGAGRDEALRALVANPAIAANPAVGQLNAQLLRYETARDSLLSGAHPRALTDPDVQRLETLVRNTQDRALGAVRSHMASIDTRLQALADLRARNATSLQALPDAEAAEMRVAQEVATAQALAEQLRKEYQMARISEAVEAGQVEILDYPALPSPVSSRRPLILLVGLCGGVLLGLGLGVVREQLNTSLRKREDVERLLGVTNLGIVPKLSVGSRRPGWIGRLLGRPAAGEQALDIHVLVASAQSRTTGAEAFRTLRTNLLFSQAVHALRTIVVTSANPGEGKSTTSSNLAAAFAQQGLRVLLVDCDLRRPRLHEIFGVPREPGFTQYLLGQAPLDRLARATEVANLHVLTAGTLPPNPAELLGSARAREVVRLLNDQFDLVIFDSPPVLAASDAVIMGRFADGVVLVLRAGTTTHHSARQVIRQLRSVGASLLGTVLNDPDAAIPAFEGSYGYGYGYQYGYGYGYGAYYGQETGPASREKVGSGS